jgi:hypothetical protein
MDNCVLAALQIRMESFIIWKHRCRIFETLIPIQSWGQNKMPVGHCYLGASLVVRCTDLGAHSLSDSSWRQTYQLQETWHHSQKHIWDSPCHQDPCNGSNLGEANISIQICFEQKETCPWHFMCEITRIPCYSENQACALLVWDQLGIWCLQGKKEIASPFPIQLLVKC